MKVGCISFNNLRFAPYLSKYVSIMNRNNVDYRIAYWDRDGLMDNSYADIDKNRVYKFSYYSDYGAPRFKKISGFLKYKKFIEAYVEANKFDLLIVFTTIPAVLISKLLISKYKNRYILDIRDYTYEHIKTYKSILKRLVDSSRFTCISSRGFLNFLPPSDKYVLTHNFQYEALSKRDLGKINGASPRLRVRQWGMIKDAGVNKKIIDIFGGDSRFELYYYGYGVDKENLEQYCLSKGIGNVKFTGIYLPEEKYSFIAGTDIIHNAFTKGDHITGNAVSNKFYDSVIHRIPQLVTSGTYMGELVDKYYLGCVLDWDKATADYVYGWYLNFDRKLFEDRCDMLLDEFLKDDIVFTKKVEEFCKA